MREIHSFQSVSSSAVIRTDRIIIKFLALVGRWQRLEIQQAVEGNELVISHSRVSKSLNY